MKYKILIITGLMTLFFSSCASDQLQDIETELAMHFSVFESEAELRGKIVDISALELDGYVESIRERGVLGQCNTFTDGSKTIVIDDNYWNSITDLDKEYIVFHELGHCVLHRAHDESRKANGDCYSIMQSGLTSCNSTYNLSNRSELLNELFK